MPGSVRSLIIGQQVTAASRTGFYVQAANGASGLSPALAQIITRQPGVRAVTEVRQTTAIVAGTTDRTVDGVDPAAIGRFTDLGVTSGRLSALATPGTIMVSSDAASGHGWKPAWPNLGQLDQELVTQILQKLSAARFDQAFSTSLALTRRQAVDIAQAAVPRSPTGESAS